MDLLLITEETNSHFVLIKDFNKFMFHHTKHNASKQFCMYCLQCFSSEQILLNHTENCISINGEQAIKMPVKRSKIKFMNFHKQQAVPFVIYADFEAITEKIQACKLMMINHILKLIKSMQTVVMVIKSYVVMMINTANQFIFIEVKMLYTNLWKKCLKRLNIVKNIIKTKFNKP